MNAAAKVIYAVLLYPPNGKPRVIELPKISGMKLVSTFKTKELAEQALEKFLIENPEYQKWNNGSIQN